MSRIDLRHVAVAGPHGPLLDDVTLTLLTGHVLLVPGEPGPHQTALCLAVAGRMRARTGQVLLDGAGDDVSLRAVTAVVDGEDVSAPDGALRLRSVVGEELGLAGRRPRRRATEQWLNRHGIAEHAARRIDQLPPAVRTRALAELATHRPAVRFLLLDQPDRHGGRVEDWYSLAGDLAARGYGVLVTCAPSSARLLGLDPDTITDVALDTDITEIR